MRTEGEDGLPLNFSKKECRDAELKNGLKGEIRVLELSPMYTKLSQAMEAWMKDAWMHSNYFGTIEWSPSLYSRPQLCRR